MSATERNKTEGNGASQPPSLGQVLKGARASRGLTLEQLSTELRIEAVQLQALEQDQLERIGPPVFVKGYLRHYGTRLGLDYSDLLSLYYKQAQNRDVYVKPSRSIDLRDERQITIWIVAAIVLVAVTVALAVWWMTSSAGTPPVSAAPAAQQPRAELPRAEQPRAERLQAVDAAPAATNAQAPGVEATPTAAAAASESAVSPPSQPPAGVDPSSIPRDSPPPQAFAPAAAAAAPKLPFTLSLTQESWVEISDAHGERLFYGLAAPGRREELSGEPPILVLLGNADGVQLTVNAEDYPIPRAGQGKLARFTLTAPED